MRAFNIFLMSLRSTHTSHASGVSGSRRDASKSGRGTPATSVSDTRGAGVLRIVIFMRAELGSILVPDNDLECFEYPKVTPLWVVCMVFSESNPKKSTPDL